MPVMFCNNVGFIHGSQEVVYLSITDNAKENEWDMAWFKYKLNLHLLQIIN